MFEEQVVGGEAQRRQNCGAQVLDWLRLLNRPQAPTVAWYYAFASQAGRLDAWIDFNADGDWDDAGEKITDNLPVAAGSDLIASQLPAGVASGNTYACFRFSTVGGLDPVKLADDGGVEDYQVAIVSDTTELRLQLPSGASASVVGTSTQASVLVGGEVVFSAPKSNLSSITLTSAALQLNFDTWT